MSLSTSPADTHRQASRGSLISKTVFGVGVVVTSLLFLAGAWERRWIADDGLIVLRTVRNLLAGNCFTSKQNSFPDSEMIDAFWDSAIFQKFNGTRIGSCQQFKFDSERFLHFICQIYKFLIVLCCRYDAIQICEVCAQTDHFYTIQ